MLHQFQLQADHIIYLIEYIQVYIYILISVIKYIHISLFLMCFIQVLRN